MAIDCRGQHQLLNPLVSLQKHNKKETHDKNNETRRNESKATTSSKEWINSGKALTHNVRRRNSKPILNINLCGILAELDNHDKNSGIEKIMCTIQNDKEVKRLKNKIKEIEERFDAESIVVKTLKSLVCSLNNDKVKFQQQLSSKMKKLNRD